MLFKVFNQIFRRNVCFNGRTATKKTFLQMIVQNLGSSLWAQKLVLRMQNHWFFVALIFCGIFWFVQTLYKLKHAQINRMCYTKANKNPLDQLQIIIVFFFYNILYVRKWNSVRLMALLILIKLADSMIN